MSPCVDGFSVGAYPLMKLLLICRSCVLFCEPEGVIISLFFYSLFLRGTSECPILFCSCRNYFDSSSVSP